jgi:hypothetical protein
MISPLNVSDTSVLSKKGRSLAKVGRTRRSTLMLCKKLAVLMAAFALATVGVTNSAMAQRHGGVRVAAMGHSAVVGPRVGGVGGPRIGGPRFVGPRFVGPRFGGPRFVGPRFSGVRVARAPFGFRRPFVRRRFVGPGFFGFGLYAGYSCWRWAPTAWGPRRVWACGYPNYAYYY